MYTWGYIKDVTLAKLDLDETEATEQNQLSRFPFWANEAMTQICSAIKPKRTFAQIKIEDKLTVWKELCQRHNLYNPGVIITKPTILTDEEKTFWSDYDTHYFVGELQSMPDDFISFGDDVNIREWSDYWHNTVISKSHDDELTFKGYNQIIFWKEGTYTISYNARWYQFDKDIDNDIEIDVPMDILDCLPSYIAHQCYKIDDEVKAAIYRNEYEMFLSRIDNTDYKQTKTFKIGGDW